MKASLCHPEKGEQWKVLCQLRDTKELEAETLNHRSLVRPSTECQDWQNPINSEKSVQVSKPQRGRGGHMGELQILSEKQACRKAKNENIISE